MEWEDNDELIELVDEEGETVRFKHLVTVEHEGELYIMLLTAESAADDEAEEGDVVILKIAKDDKGQDCYVSLDDDDVTQVVYDKCLAMIEEEDDDIPG